MLRIGIFTPRTGGVAVISIIGRGISTGTARGRSAMLTGRRIAPRAVVHAMTGVFVIRVAAVPAIGFAPVLTAGIFLPRAVAITMAARIDGFTFGLTASTGVRTVTVAGAGCVALVVQHPCMAAAGRAGPGPIAAVAVLLVNVSAKIFYIMAL